MSRIFACVLDVCVILFCSCPAITVLPVSVYLYLYLSISNRTIAPIRRPLLLLLTTCPSVTVRPVNVPYFYVYPIRVLSSRFYTCASLTTLICNGAGGERVD